MSAQTLVSLDAILVPTERLLVAGGDSRVSLDPVSQLNKYGCSAVPRKCAAALSSCTASSPSELSYRAADDVRQELVRTILSGRTLNDAFSAAVENTRRDLATIFGFDRLHGAELMLAASGTDCELYALQLALHADDRNITSIIVGPDEIGSGSLGAASGRHFDALAPMVRPVTVGAPVDGFALDRLRVETVPIRDATGSPIPLADTEEAVARLARAAVARGERVLLHLVDSSKTGLRAPSIAAVRRLHQELGDNVIVVVDAAQMRTRFETLVEYVAAGWMVMVSGSKFFTGPPFSGALVVPRTLARPAARMETVPAGLSAYFTAFDVPPSWKAVRAVLPSTPNFGTLARWRAALAEMRAFAEMDEQSRDRRLETLSKSVQSAMSSRDCLDLLASPPGERDGAVEHWDAWPTIWTFALNRSAAMEGRRTVLGYDEAWQIYVWLNGDLSSMLPPHAGSREQRVAAGKCHIGQPVKLKWRDGEIAGVLRIALGARSVREGVADITCVLDKIEVILKYWPELAARRKAVA